MKFTVRLEGLSEAQLDARVADLRERLRNRNREGVAVADSNGRGDGEVPRPGDGDARPPGSLS